LCCLRAMTQKMGSWAPLTRSMFGLT